MKTFKQFTTSANGSLKNTHIEHPEDSVLNGDLTVLNWFTENGKISAKIDGAPAICLLYTSPSPRDGLLSRMPSSA